MMFTLLGFLLKKLTIGVLGSWKDSKLKPLANEDCDWPSPLEMEPMPLKFPI